MKKFSFLLIIFILMFSLTGCTSKEKPKTSIMCIMGQRLDILIHYLMVKEFQNVANLLTK